jgi:hypothetical protein
MLDPKILDRSRRLIKADFVKYQKLFLEEIGRTKRQAQIRHIGSSSRMIKQIHDICCNEINTRSEVVWQIFLRVHKTFGSQLTETLGLDLKEEISHYIDKITEEISEVMSHGSREMQGLDFQSAMDNAREKIYTEIDLYVDELSLKSTIPKKDFGTVFISHAAEDRSLAEAFKEQLDKIFGGCINVFISSIPGIIPPGSDWFDNILENLKISDAFIILFTPLSKERRFVWFEIGFSWFRKLNTNCEMYTLFTPPIKVSDIPSPLNRLQNTSIVKEDEIKAFFKKLTEQFNRGNVDLLDITHIHQVLPKYEENNGSEADERIRSEVIRNEINQLLLGGIWYRAELLIGHMSKSFPEKSVKNAITKMEKEGKITWGGGPLNPDSKISLINSVT